MTDKLNQHEAPSTPPSTGVTPSDEQVIWFHGTAAENAEAIRRDGFKVDTWFSRHMEDAVKFGGPHVFVVKMTIDSAPLDWQIHMANAMPPSIIVEEKYVAAATGVTEEGFEDEI